MANKHPVSRLDFIKLFTDKQVGGGNIGDLFVFFDQKGKADAPHLWATDGIALFVAIQIDTYMSRDEPISNSSLSLLEEVCETNAEILNNFAEAIRDYRAEQFEDNDE